MRAAFLVFALLAFPVIAQDGNASKRLLRLENLAAVAASDTELATAISAHEAASNPHPTYLTSAEGNAAYQPLDADLTSVAALTTTAHGRGLLDDADAAASRASVGVTEVMFLLDNCVLENDATPIPDSCVGDGSDGGGGFTSFNADGDNNSPQTITDGNELLIAGGTNGIDTVAGATDTVTLNLDLSESAAGGELGGNLDAPTIDDSVTVTGWVMGASTATSPAADDNDASLATSAFVQGEIDDGDNLTNNCALENDATPIPDSCVGDGSDAGSGGAPSTADYLVGTADGGLSAEIVVGTSPGGELGGTWASPTLDDTITVQDWTLNEPVFGAGAAGANTWPKFTSGTVLTTAEDGAIEVDADAFYGTTDAGNRGQIPVRHLIRAAADQTLTNTTAAQQIFDSPANGQITLETGAYIFELHLQVTGMSATSGNGQILFAGTGTFAGWNWRAGGLDNSTLTTISADLAAYFLTNASAASVVTGATGTALRVVARGSFECSVAGTLIPQIDLVTGAAAIVEEGSFFTVERVGATAAANIGQWD